MGGLKKKAAVFFLVASLVLPLISCGALKDTGAGTKQKMTDIFFDTVVDIQFRAKDDGSIIDECRQICERYEKMLSPSDKNSDVSKINSANGKPVRVFDETAFLIKKGLYYSELSGGLFDITIAPLSGLWDIRDNPGVIPKIKDIEEAKSHVNYKNVVVRGNTVTLKDPKAGIDLGALAKGFVADRIKEYLISKGVRHAIINLGRNILTVGKKPGGGNFRIGIQKPFAPGNEILTAVKANDKSVVSSGVYERYFEKDGKRYHHILNPKTGFPFENGLLQVTIISDSSLDGDALSTACFAMGLEKGSELIDSLGDIQAVFVTEDYAMHCVGGIKTQ